MAEQATPPTMTVKVTIGFVRGCAACETIARDLAMSALTDATVTGFTALPGRQHACGATTAPKLASGASTAQPDRVQLEASGQGNLPLPSSGTNGFDA